MVKQKKNARKVAATTLSAALAASAIVPAAVSADSGYSDVSANDWFKDAVDYVTENGVMQGVGGDRFNPAGVLTRAEAAQIFANALDLEATENSGYSDVEAGSWYEDAVNAVISEGILGDTSSDNSKKFSPDAVFTRAQAAKAIVDAYDLEGSTDLSGYPDADKLPSWAEDTFGTAVANGVIDGKFTGGQTVLAPNDEITRAEVAQIMQNILESQEQDVEIESVEAIDESTAKVTFNTAVQDLDHTNFSIDGGLSVTEATLANDGKSATIKVDDTFTRNQEYTLTATGLKNSAGEEAGELTGKFVWSVDEGISVSLSKTDLDVDEEATLSVVDEDNKDVSGASVEISSSNTNVVTVSGNTPENTKVKGVAEGEAQVTVKVTLADGTVLRNTFNINVTEVEEEYVAQGFTLHTGDGLPANTVDFNNQAKKTWITAGAEPEKVALFDTVDGNPAVAHIHGEELEGASITANNPTIATAEITDGEREIEVTPSQTQTGKAGFTLELEDGRTIDFEVEVRETPEFVDFELDRNSVTLSDETSAGDIFIEGVNKQTVEVKGLDQYDDIINHNEGKITVSVDTDGLKLSETELDLSNDGTDTFEIKSLRDEIVSGTVKINYFENENDDNPAFSKSIDVNVVDVDADATVQNIDVVAPSAIYANPTYPQVEEIDYENEATVYTLDKDGNRLNTSSVSGVEFTDTTSNDWAEISGNTLKFEDLDEAKVYMTEDSDVDVEITASGVTSTQTIDVNNGLNIPTSANVATDSIAIDLSEKDNGQVTFEEILFGVVDSDQLVIDDVVEEAGIIAVKNNAENGGYQFNKPAVTIKDQAGDIIDLGVNVYGADESLATGNFWNTPSTLDVTEKFDVDFELTNWSGNISKPNSPSLSTALSGKAQFTIVVNKVYVAGNDEYNILDTPVSINVSVSN